MLIRVTYGNCFLCQDIGLWYTSYCLCLCGLDGSSNTAVVVMDGGWGVLVDTGWHWQQQSFTEVHAMHWARLSPTGRSCGALWGQGPRAGCPSQLGWKNLPGSSQDSGAGAPAFCIACKVVIQKQAALKRVCQKGGIMFGIPYLYWEAMVRCSAHFLCPPMLR